MKKVLVVCLILMLMTCIVFADASTDIDYYTLYNPQSYADWVSQFGSASVPSEDVYNEFCYRCEGMYLYSVKYYYTGYHVSLYASDSPLTISYTGDVSTSFDVILDNPGLGMSYTTRSGGVYYDRLIDSLSVPATVQSADDRLLDVFFCQPNIIMAARVVPTLIRSQLQIILPAGILVLGLIVLLVLLPTLRRRFI